MISFQMQPGMIQMLIFEYLLEIFIRFSFSHAYDEPLQSESLAI